MRGLIKFMIFLAALVGIGYGALVIYNIAVEDATQRIRQGVEEGVSRGMRKGAGNILNPFKWFRRKKTV